MRLVVVVVLCCLGAAPAAQGWVIRGDRWAGKEITVWNTTGYAAPVRDAMHSWNAAGARIRFVPAASPSAANVVIRLGGGGDRGEATVGYAPDGSTILLARGLGRIAATALAAHELGHVLGLGHESRRCSVMAPVVRAGRASECGIAACRTLWRCLVRPDDAAGLRALYGRRRGA